jgi:hypothetical protein
MKTKFLLKTDFSGIVNGNIFSVAPSIINEKVKKCVVPLCQCLYFAKTPFMAKHESHQITPNQKAFIKL